MKCTIIGCFIALFAFTWCYAFVDGAPPGHTGAPGETTCADAGCHDMISSRAGGIAVAFITPQHHDTVGVRIWIGDGGPDPHIEHWGFQVTILDSMDQPFGEILISDSLRTQLITDSTGRTYLTHTAVGVTDYCCGITARWPFRWVRPSGAQIADPVYIYSAGLLADGDGSTVNDVTKVNAQVGPFCPVKLTGDVNASGAIGSADIIKMVGYLFKGDTPPVPCAAAGDVNCDAVVTSGDMISLINHVFKSQELPCDDVCPLIIDGTWACP